MVRNWCKRRLQEVICLIFWVFMEKKFDRTLNIVKNGIAEPEMKHIKNISRGYQFEDDAIAQFESIIRLNTARYVLFHFGNGV